MSNPPSLEQVARFIASDNMKDIIPKLVFLQKQKSLSEEFIENAKNVALKSLTGISSPSSFKFPWIQSSLLILISVFGTDFLVRKLYAWIMADQEARLSSIASLDLLLSCIKSSLLTKLENHQTILIKEALTGMSERLSADDLIPPQSLQNKKENLIRAVKGLSSTVLYMEDQVREQRFYIPDRQILALIKQIKSDILRRRRMTSLPLLVGL